MPPLCIRTPMLLPLCLKRKIIFPTRSAVYHILIQPAIQCDVTAVSSVVMSALTQSTPLTDMCCFLFFHSPAPVLGSQTVESMTLLPSQQRNNRLCDKGSLKPPWGTSMFKQVGQHSYKGQKVSFQFSGS